MTTNLRAPCAWLMGLAVSFSLTIGACERAETASSELDGVWQSRDYGLIIENAGGRSRQIEQTGVSCLLTDDKAVDRLEDALVGAPDLEKGTFAIGSNATLSAKTFDRLDDNGFERLCPQGLTGEATDPELNFEVLWQTFDRHYAFFNERQVDWDAVYAAFRPRITKDMSSRELGRLLDEILEQLKDGHVGLVIDGDDVVSVDTRLDIRFLNECRRQQAAACNIDDDLDDYYQVNNDIIRTTYLDSDFRTALNGQALWGKLNEFTGYFRIDAMEGLASRNSSASSDLAALDVVLDQMLGDLGHLPAMIIDVRLNGGGYDTVAVAIADRFADERRVFGSKQAFLGGDETVSTDLVVDPAEGPRFEGSVVVLTSELTASAAEIFTMAMHALPHVTLIGAATQGILSDELYRTLPNGWEFSLSNEIYLAHDGALFEAIGVPPAIDVPFLLPKDLDKGVDPGIDTALALLAESAWSGEKSH